MPATSSHHATLHASLPKRPCPVCNALNTRHLFSQSFEQLSNINLLDGYEVVVCQRCGAGFADHIPEQTVFDQYYRELSKYERDDRGGKGSAYDERRFQDTAASIIPHIPNRQSRILEIGCATGQLLSMVKENGFADVLGVDPSPACATVADKLYGVQVQTHSIFDIPRPPQPFDFILLVGVMEHIRDLDRAIEKIRELLAQGGRLYMMVPDAANFPQQKDAPYQEFSLEHLNFFSATSLRNLMITRGFSFRAQGKLYLEHWRATWCSLVYCVFENTAPATSTIVRDEETEPGLAGYIRRSEAIESSVCEKVARLADSANPIVVWGTGSHTQRLLATGGLGRVNISAFVDSNPKFQGRRLHGIPIVPPRALHSRSEPILISSYAAQHEIAHQIRDELRIHNELIVLYDI